MLMLSPRLRVVAVALAFSLLAGGLWADSDSATQTFTLTIPSVLSITAPSATVVKAHSGTDSEQAFGTQVWGVNQNQVLGSTVTFSVAAPFVHDSATINNKRDCRLTLSIASSETLAVWTLSTATDETDYAASANTATVSAGSLSAGNATFNLVVTFVDEDYSTLPTGSFSTVVTGTVSSNL
jgi:hypothetical protein